MAKPTKSVRKTSSASTVTCDPKIVASFDYSKLDPAFAKLSKPAQRALLNAGIRTPAALAKWTLKDVAALHGMGPGSFPVLKAALKSKSLSFRV
jgi:hypothetical protein